MGEKTENIKKLLKEEKSNFEVVSELLDLFEEMEQKVITLSKKCERLENELDALNEDVSMLNDGMHMEDYDPIVEATCPYCQEDIEINLDSLEDEDEFKCPHCGKEITLEWDSDCDCGEDHECDCDDCNPEK